jgi:peptidoglycan/LPS O-acetylase OafA/YrhL
VFFVISGYLITSIIWTELDKESFSFLDFYARRIRRIFPALLIVLIACLALGWVFIGRHTYT